MGCIENERCFLNLGFMKSKLRNKMTTYLDLVVRMFDQKFFTLNTFPFAITMSYWISAKSHHGAKGEFKQPKISKP